MNKLVVGITVALVFTGLIILSIEKGFSFLQILIPFIIFLFPFIFLSSFKSNLGAFILVTVSILFAYISYRYGYHDTWVGVAMVFVLGFPIYYFKVRHTKVD